MPSSRLSREEILALSDINPEFHELVTTSPLNISLDSKEAILQLKAYLRSLPHVIPADAKFIEEDRRIPVRDGTEITVRVHKPIHPPQDGSPLFVVYHGGGFCLGGLNDEQWLCRKWTELGGVAVNVDYRTTPEHPFPTPVNDAYDALKWVASHTDVLGANPSKGFLIGGTSAGANLAAIASHLAQMDNITPSLTGVFLQIPATANPEAVPPEYKDMYLSREQLRNAPILSGTAVALFEEMYNPEPKSKLRNPILYQHHGQPPTYILVCGLDPIRDEGIIYNQALSDTGVKTRMDIFAGLPHGFWSTFPEANFAKDYREKSVDGLRWLLHQVGSQ